MGAHPFIIFFVENKGGEYRPLKIVNYKICNNFSLEKVTTFLYCLIEINA